MATRSRIGYESPDGTVISAYHHWDGYPEWLGRILQTHYNSKELVTELISGGDMSSCWTKSTWTTDMSGCNRVQEDEYGPLYYSDRGEKCPPRHDSNRVTYLLNGEEFAYLFTQDGEWICWDRNEYGSNIPELVEIPSGSLAV